MERPVLGLTGILCSGKDSWGSLFETEFGFEHRSTSDVARAHIAEHNLGEPTRDRLREVCTQLRHERGVDYLVRTALEQIPDSTPAVISGLYVVAEADFIHQAGGKIIHVVSPEELSYSRMLSRHRSGEDGAFEEFQRLISNDLHSSETDQRMSDVLKMADYEIDGAIPIADTERCRRVAAGLLDLAGVSYA